MTKTPESLGAEALANIRSIDWVGLSHDQLNMIGRAVNKLSDDPKYMWGVFRFYTQMLRGSRVYEAVGLMREGNTRFRLRETWLAINGTDVSEPEVYRSIEGTDGYEAYMEYSQSLKEELDKVPFYESVVAGKVSDDDSHATLVKRLFKEYVPGENW